MQFAILISVAILAAGCASDPKLSVSDSPRSFSDIEYGQAGGESLRLDAFVPAGTGPFAAAIMVHGGGWGGGDKAKDITGILHALGDAHVAWFSINYRLAPKYQWPACYDDVRAAVRWVKSHAADYRVDPNRIALIGYSAGGELVCLAAVQAGGDEQVNAIVGVSAPTDLEADTKRRGGLSKSLTALFGTNVLDDRTHELLREMSAINFVHPGLPPFLLIHGTADKSVPYQQSVNFQAKLRQAGVACDLVTLTGAPHDINKWDAIDGTYKQKLVEWFRNTLSR
jgi:acetyl esterase/lipase